MVHSLSQHKLKVRCVAAEGRYAVSGSWDRTAVLWDLIMGSCLRIIKHEMQIRCVSMDTQRIITGWISVDIFPTFYLSLPRLKPIPKIRPTFSRKSFIFSKIVRKIPPKYE